MQGFSPPDSIKAQVLAEATYQPDSVVAARWDIARQTIVKWRRDFAQDDNLSQLLTEKAAELYDQWANEIDPAILAGIEYLKGAMQEMPKEAECVKAAAGALKILGGLKIAKELVDARNSGGRTQDSPASGKVH